MALQVKEGLFTVTKMEKGGAHLTKNEFSITIITHNIRQAAFLGQDLMPWLPRELNQSHAQMWGKFCKKRKKKPTSPAMDGE